MSSCTYPPCSVRASAHLCGKDNRGYLALLVRGPHRSGEIAEKLNDSVRTVEPVRSSRISTGMIYSPARGETGFTVPLYDQYLRRMMS